MMWDDQVILDVATLRAQMEGELEHTLLGRVWSYAKMWPGPNWASRTERLLREAGVPLWEEEDKWGPVKADLTLREKRKE